VALQLMSLLGNNSGWCYAALQRLRAIFFVFFYLEKSSTTSFMHERDKEKESEKDKEREGFETCLVSFFPTPVLLVLLRSWRYWLVLNNTSSVQ
jgi:hypothetical protein